MLHVALTKMSKQHATAVKSYGFEKIDLSEYIYRNISF